MTLEELIKWHYDQSCHWYELAASSPRDSLDRKGRDRAGDFHNEAADYLTALRAHVPDGVKTND